MTKIIKVENCGDCNRQHKCGTFQKYAFGGNTEGITLVFSDIPPHCLLEDYNGETINELRKVIIELEKQREELEKKLEKEAVK